MKKELYEQPQVEVVEMEVEGPVLEGSNGSGSNNPSIGWDD